jgi:hypothetical protein
MQLMDQHILIPQDKENLPEEAYRCAQDKKQFEQYLSDANLPERLLSRHRRFSIVRRLLRLYFNRPQISPGCGPLVIASGRAVL